IPMLKIFYSPELVQILLLSLLAIIIVAFAGYLFTKQKYYSIFTYITSILFLGTGFGYVANKVLKEYQIMRLAVFLDPNIDPLGSGWNIIQSITAIGSGGILGKGFLQGTQSHYRYLPQQSTDFIFSILAEEFGFIGCFAIFLVYFFIIFRMIKIMRNNRDTFAQGIIAGVISMMLFHFAINVGMAMGIMPITGIPLLFLSYGGSSLLSNCITFGIVISIGSARERLA
ncbi:MAG: rod shape-determining protein RodA, partial [Spirochaetes bacterium]|nr:rod shape-determining protein RodA [Spirochaetota bacterium]